MANGGDVIFNFKGDDSNLNKTTKTATNTLKNIGTTVGKSMLVATGAVTTAFAGMVTASVKARGDIEQSIGGVETLFKKSANEVIKNANKAYKTAGISANQYMEQVTSFSASLLQSVAGDTKKASKTADMAIIDMADNANKMGTSMEMIQNAYQGFAKQNYTMLDNLKLGYGGTKKEMLRLLKDAEKVTKIKYDINNLNDVYSAIHVIQGELGITGTTAKEAEQTLTGSISALKASWENFLSGSGNLGKVVDSAMTAVNNIVRIVGDAVPYIINDITQNLPRILETGGQLLKNLVNGILQNMPSLIDATLQIINSLSIGLINALPKILEVGMQVISKLIQGITKMLPTLIPQALKTIITLVNGLLDNIDQLIDAGIELIIGLADGLINAIPLLIEKAPIIIDKLVNAIARNLPKLMSTGIKLIIKLGEGLIKAIPQIVSKIPQIVHSIVSAFGNLASNFFNIGSNIVKGIWNGIGNTAGWLFDKIRGFKDAVLNKFKSFFGIHSPSTLLRDQIGIYMAKGIGEGFSEEMVTVSKQMNKALATIGLGDMFELSPTLNRTSSSSTNVNVTVYNNMETDFMGNLVNNIRTYSNGAKNDYNYGMI